MLHVSASISVNNHRVIVFIFGTHLIVSLRPSKSKISKAIDRFLTPGTNICKGDNGYLITIVLNILIPLINH